jgi:hypothetical protein
MQKKSNKFVTCRNVNVEENEKKKMGNGSEEDAKVVKWKLNQI